MYNVYYCMYNVYYCMYNVYYCMYNVYYCMYNVYYCMYNVYYCMYNVYYCMYNVYYCMYNVYYCMYNVCMDSKEQLINRSVLSERLLVKLSQHLPLLLDELMQWHVVGRRGWGMTPKNNEWKSLLFNGLLHSSFSELASPLYVCVGGGGGVVRVSGVGGVWPGDNGIGWVWSVGGVWPGDQWGGRGVAR